MTEEIEQLLGQPVPG